MTFKIAGKDFYEYVAYRLKKDGLGFTPSVSWREGSTDCKTFIKSVIPKNVYDFFVYAHELGHCKSVQLPRISNGFWDGSVSNETLQNEYNAWVWALRYIKKLKISFTKEEITRALNNSFRSYTRKASSKAYANTLIKKLNKFLNIDLQLESLKYDHYDTYNMYGDKILTTGTWTSVPCPDWGDGWFKPVIAWDKPQKAEPPKNKKHQPWMDMLDKQRKKYNKTAIKRA